MSIVNGIIQAPVSIADVKTVLGETSNDLATLCKSDKVNMWAKYKPVELKRPFTNDEFDFANNRWRDDAVWFKGVNFEEDGVCGLKVTHGGSLSAVIDLYDKNTAGWKRVKPGTTFACPYRLTDFIDYKHTATPPFAKPIITSETHESGSVIATAMMKNLNTEYELTLQNLGILSETYFGLALKNAAGQIAYFKTSDRPLKNGSVIVEIKNGNLTPGSYTAYVFLCSSALALNTPPAQATTYYTVPDFAPSAVEIVSDAQHAHDDFAINAHEDARGHIIVELEIKDSYVRSTDNKDFDIRLRFTESRLGSQMQTGEQAYTFTNLEAGKKYTHVFTSLEAKRKYKIEYTFVGITQEIYILQQNPLIH